MGTGRKKKWIRGTDRYAMLEKMYFLNTAWKKDILLWGFSLKCAMKDYEPQRPNLSKCYWSLVNEGLLVENEPLYPEDSEIRKVNPHRAKSEKDRSLYTTVSITKKGINFLIDNESNPLMADYFEKNRDYYQKRFRTNDVNKLIRQLLISREMCLLGRWGVRVHPAEKPTLKNLERLLNGMTSVDDNPLYKNSSYTDIIHHLDQSHYFYTSDEIKEYAGVTADTFRGSTCLGFVIGKTTMSMIYCETPGKQTLASFGGYHDKNAELSLREKSLYEILSGRFSNEKNISIYGKREQISLIVFTDGDASVPEAVIGAKFGKMKVRLSKKDLSSLKEDQLSQAAEAALVKRQNAVSSPYSITAKSELAESIFFVPVKYEGLIQLGYLLTNDPLSYQEECYNLTSTLSDMCTNVSPYKNGSEQRRPYKPIDCFGLYDDGSFDVIGVILIPAYDIKYLKTLAQNHQYDGYCVIAPADMVETISRCIRKKCYFFDYRTGNRVLRDSDKKQILVEEADYQGIKAIVEVNGKYGSGYTYTDSMLADYKNNPKDLLKIVSSQNGDTSEFKQPPMEIQQYNEQGYPVEEANVGSLVVTEKSKQYRPAKRSDFTYHYFKLNKEDEKKFREAYRYSGSTSTTKMIYDMVIDQINELSDLYHKQQKERKEDL